MGIIGLVQEVRRSYHRSHVVVNDILLFTIARLAITVRFMLFRLLKESDWLSGLFLDLHQRPIILLVFVFTLDCVFFLFLFLFFFFFFFLLAIRIGHKKHWFPDCWRSLSVR